MRNKLFTVFTLLIVSLVVSITATSVYARAITEEGSITVSDDEIYDEDLLLAGDTVTINGTVNGDVYVAAGVITVTGTINGDLLATGGNIDISGTVTQDLRVGGGVISVRNATIGDNATFLGGRIYVSNDVRIEGTTIFAGGQVISEADIGRELYIGAGEVTLNSTVEKDVSVGAGTITLGPETNFKKDFTYNQDSQLNKDSAALIAGESITLNTGLRSSIKEYENNNMEERVVRGLNVGFSVLSYFSALLLGLLMIYFFRLPAKNVVTTMVKRPWGTLGWGIVVLIITGPFLGLLMLTVVGIPLAILLLVTFLFSLYFAKIFVGLLIGTYIAQYMDKNKPNAYVSFGLGLFVYYLLTMIPRVDFVVGLVSVIFALGALFINARRRLFFERK